MTITLTETNRQRRGHRFLPPERGLTRIPALYATEDIAVEDKTIWAHYFAGGCDWYVAELDPASGRAFGYVNLGIDADAEWGLFSLAFLEPLIVPQGVIIGAQRITVPLVIERDCEWVPRPWRDVRPL